MNLVRQTFQRCTKADIATRRWFQRCRSAPKVPRRRRLATSACWISLRQHMPEARRENDSPRSSQITQEPMTERRLAAASPRFDSEEKIRVGHTPERMDTSTIALTVFSSSAVSYAASGLSVQVNRSARESEASSSNADSRSVPLDCPQLSGPFLLAAR